MIKMKLKNKMKQKARVNRCIDSMVNVQYYTLSCKVLHLSLHFHLMHVKSHHNLKNAKESDKPVSSSILFAL